MYSDIYRKVSCGVNMTSSVVQGLLHQKVDLQA